LCKFYKEKYNVSLNQQQVFFNPPEKIREILIMKVTEITQNRAAKKIQAWFRSKLRREEFRRLVIREVKAIRRVQAWWKFYKAHKLIPRRVHRVQVKCAMLITRVMKGY